MNADRPQLAITGATGFLGGTVARTLAAAGLPLRLLARDVSKAPALRDATVVPFSFADHAASVRALKGIQTLFMVSASESAERVEQHRSFLDAARAAGVRHVVYTSFFGAAANATFTLARDHYFTEDHLRRSGMNYTFLRDNLYLDFMRGMVGDDGVIRGPAGDGRAAIVARDDVARVASAVLHAPEKHVDVTYELTGPEALSLTEVATILADATGKPISFHHETVAEAYSSRRRWPAPQWQYDAWVSTYLAIANGDLSRVTGDVKAVTGTGPQSLAQFLDGTKGETAPA